jgi:MFS family permease
MTYWGELRTNWRYLAAASIGLGAGYSLTNYINNVFTPHLIGEFNWSKSDIALIGIAAVLAIITQPIAGRLTDAFGVRRMAIVGVVAAPVLFFCLSLMTGALPLFFLLTFIQVIVVGGTTSPTIYSRLIAQQFVGARGIALAISAATPAALGAASVPFLSSFIDANGWRAGYVAVAIGTAIAGVAAILLIPARTEPVAKATRVTSARSVSYGEILRSPAFQLIVGGMILCNLSFSMQTSQLKVVLLDQGVDSATGSLAISLFAVGVVVGRFLCGFALDRFPTYAVAAISLGLPGVGLTILASGASAPTVVIAAVLMLGLCMGAEGDLLAYLVMRFFKLDVYSTVLGLVLGAVGLSITAGSLLLSFTLKSSGSYVQFLTLSGIAALLGSGMFTLLKRVPEEPVAPPLALATHG